MEGGEEKSIHQSEQQKSKRVIPYVMLKPFQANRKGIPAQCSNYQQELAVQLL